MEIEEHDIPFFPEQSVDVTECERKWCWLQLRPFKTSPVTKCSVRATLNRLNETEPSEPCNMLQLIAPIGTLI